jgi:hypothetical protein
VRDIDDDTNFLCFHGGIVTCVPLNVSVLIMHARGSDMPVGSITNHACRRQFQVSSHFLVFVGFSK